ncbi:hypothetical protein DL98DRAFT_165277 [Cadophora sp. DSE1049]|nr:hypothetical protein DL98DRAFT_165277 [Cadophora sp. DSE1049]
MIMNAFFHSGTLGTRYYTPTCPVRFPTTTTHPSINHPRGTPLLAVAENLGSDEAWSSNGKGIMDMSNTAPSTSEPLTKQIPTSKAGPLATAASRSPALGSKKSPIIINDSDEEPIIPPPVQAAHYECWMYKGLAHGLESD